MVLSKNPLFPDKDDSDADDNKPEGYLMPGKTGKVEPLHSREELRQQNETEKKGANPAADLIRDKLNRIYDESEPDAAEEANEVVETAFKSPHQQFMYELSTSGKSLAEIQTEWHNYYVGLPDDQKRQVWQEFYEANDVSKRYPVPASQPKADVPKKTDETAKDKNKVVVGDHSSEAEAAKPAKKPTKPKSAKNKKSPLKSTWQKSSKTSESAKQIKSKVTGKVKARANQVSSRIKPVHKRNLHSLAFGLACGLVVVALFMFSFFNQLIITPFIQPGRADAAPIIIDKASLAASGTPQVIIPKINVQIPVIYNIDTTNETTIETNLQDGTIHYPTTEVPGQDGNVAIFGHSSNNIFNPGHYKFAFVLLHTLKPGDVFYLTYHHKVYSYKVFRRLIVNPDQVYVLNNIPGHTATATLITCDPPGTSLHRLVVSADQISPNPATNNHHVEQNNDIPQPTHLASNGPSLWSRFWNWLF